MRRLAGLPIVIAMGSLVGCGAPAHVATRSAPKGEAIGATTKPWKPVYPASRVFPDVSTSDLALVPAPRELADHAARAAEEHRILDRMRVSIAEGGMIRRADDLLPVGTVNANELPARLGGGYVISVVNAHGTQVYRADSWLSKLKPLVEVSAVADRDGPITVGFDRLYLRLKSNNDVVAIDPASGQPMPIGPLPLAPSYGDMVFIDGWRAVVETDLRGAMATFDAGATWKTIPINERITSVGAIGSNASIVTETGEYHLDARGALSFAPSANERAAVTALEAALGTSTKQRISPIGKKPLRAVLEDGFPEEGRTGVVARAGALARVNLDDGTVIAAKEHAFSDTATCHAIKLGRRFGFVCSEPNGKTLLYEFVAPLDMKLTASFDDPRVVTESGQGLVVISGGCGAKNTDAPNLPAAPLPAGKKAPPGEPRSFCVRALDGSLREIRVRGNVGSERVVALADGRVVVLVPPRAGSMGQLSIIDGTHATHITIRVPDDAPSRELQVGMWLDGFQEVGPNEIAGWVEAGGPVVGVRIKLDGTLTSGQLVQEDNGVLVSGPFGLAIGARGRALETVDGGLSWRDIVLPVTPSATTSEIAHAEDRVRRCGPIGCVLPGVLRVGWGEPSVPNDLSEPADPPPLHVPLAKLAFSPLKLDCSPTGATSEKTRAAASRNRGRQPSATETPNSWSRFRGVDPPELGADEDGIDNGQSYDEAAPMRMYVWGKKDSDWARTGRFQIRFADPWTIASVRSSAISQSLWADEAAASTAIGVGSYGYSMEWHAYLDPRGEAALVSACRAGQPACSAIFAVDEDRPVLPFRPGPGASLAKPLHGAVRLGEAWLYLGDKGNDRLGLYRADLGTVRLLHEFSRPRSSRYTPVAPPKLVRRANGSGVGLSFVARTDVSDKKGERYILPVDADSGEVGDPIDVGPNDLSTLAPGACDTARDGWLLEVEAADPTAIVNVDGGLFNVENPEVRLRVDPGFACIEAASGKADHEPLASRSPPPKKTGSGTFPLVTTELGTEKKIAFTCSAR